jgi:hypothetical protein
MRASTVLFSDLGTGNDVYVDSGFPAAWVMAGSGAPGGSFTGADQFTVAGSGSFSVSEINLAAQHIDADDPFNSTLNTFYASIFTDVSGSPGTEVSGAYWSESTPIEGGSCCSLLSIPGITGVTLNGGQSYFLVLGPLSLTDTSWDSIALNNQGVTGDHQFSRDGGVTCIDNGDSLPIGAFDVLGTPVATPEPRLMPLLLLGIGLAGALAAKRSREESRHTVKLQGG